MDYGKLAAVVAMAALYLSTGGCNRPPAPPKTAEGRAVESITPANAAEAELAHDLESARVGYKYRLEVLRAYYQRTGALAKQQWAENELKNLAQAQTFTYAGVAPQPPQVAPPLDEVNEAALAEAVVAARRQYLAAIDRLGAYYTDAGMDFKAQLVANIRDRFDPVRTYAYFLQAEVPPADLRPREVQPQAENLFQRALQMHRSGKGLPLMPNLEKQRQALLTFQRLVREYPTSTRIAEAAFYIGYIYKEYFKENYHAVTWLERAWQWDPNLPLPARFEAAVVHDLRLHNRGRAVELYRQVLRRETFNESNVRFASNRLSELTGQRQ